MRTVETQRLAIRNFPEDDWEDLREMILQYEASEYAVYGHQWPTSEEELRGVAEWFSSGASFLAVCLKLTGRFIGFVALNPEEGHDEVVFNLGYVFNPDYHGKGYATEACRAIIDHAFAGLGAQGIITGTAEANRPSCRLLERLGLKRVGDESAESFRKSPDGKPIEFTGFMWALSKDEWESTRQEAGESEAAPGA